MTPRVREGADESRRDEYALPETAPEATGQFFNLADDPGETTNLFFTETAKRKELQALLKKLTPKENGRSAPLNRVPVMIERKFLFQSPPLRRDLPGPGLVEGLEAGHGVGLVGGVVCPLGFGIGQVVEAHAGAAGLPAGRAD